MMISEETGRRILVMLKLILEQLPTWGSIRSRTRAHRIPGRAYRLLLFRFRRNQNEALDRSVCFRRGASFIGRCLLPSIEGIPT